MQEIAWGATVGAFTALVAALAYPPIGTNDFAIPFVIGFGALVGTVVSGAFRWAYRRLF